MRILFVCLGNICRSPTARAATMEALIDLGIGNEVELDSAGLGAWHLGHGPDQRMREAAEREGLYLDDRARKVTADELDRYELILAMDRSNLHQLRRMAATDVILERIRLFRDFEVGAPPGSEVPDPYYGGVEAFPDVVRICRRAALGLADEIARRFDAETAR
jgi:protein-tyrosine phosphatase